MTNKDTHPYGENYVLNQRIRNSVRTEEGREGDKPKSTFETIHVVPVPGAVLGRRVEHLQRLNVLNLRGKCGMVGRG